MRKKLFAALAVVLSALVVASGAAPASGEPVSGQAALAQGKIHIETIMDSRCLDVYAGGAGPWVQVWTCHRGENQNFYKVDYPDGTFELRTTDYWCVDGRWGRGASLERSPCTGHPGQRWRTSLGSGGMVIWSALHANQVWDVHGNGHGTKVQLWDRNYQINQGWRFLPGGP